MCVGMSLPIEHSWSRVKQDKLKSGTTQVNRLRKAGLVGAAEREGTKSVGVPGQVGVKAERESKRSRQKGTRDEGSQVQADGGESIRMA